MVLEADSINKSYGSRRVLTAASIRVTRAHVVGLFGRMGEGKSTLLKICAGMVSPDAGWVRFAGVQHFSPRLSVLAAKGLFYLADSESLVSALTLRGHLRAVQRRFGGNNQEEVVALLDVEQLLDVPTRELSGGERRRAELAVAMFRAPTCLLVDEPFRGVDPLSAELIGSALRGMAARGCAVVLTGHEVDTLMPYLNSVVWMTSGTTYDLGAPAAAREHERFGREYLGPVRASRE